MSFSKQHLKRRLQLRARKRKGGHVSLSTKLEAYDRADYRQRFSFNDFLGKMSIKLFGALHGKSAAVPRRAAK